MLSSCRRAHGPQKQALRAAAAKAAVLDRRSARRLSRWNGAGSQIRQPLGYAIVGGLMLSQLLTLYTMPVVYLYLDGLGDWLVETAKPEAVPA